MPHIHPRAAESSAAGATRTGLIALALVAAHASAPAQDEVPFITTPDRVTLAMLELAGTRPDDHVIDLGSGDGRIVITAARRMGASGLGVEIDPALVRRSQENAAQAGVAARVAFREQDLFLTDLSRATVITMYLLPQVNLQLRERLLALQPGTRIVSHDWDMGDWQPERSLTLEVPEKAIGREKRSTVHLWRVPAPMQGTWCQGAATLRVQQRFDRYSASLQLPGGAPPQVWDGRVVVDEGLPGQVGGHTLRWSPQGVTVQSADAATAPLAGRLFTPAGAGGCR